MRVEVSVLINNHDRPGAGGNVHVWTLLNFWHAGQLDSAIVCCVNSVFGAPNSMARWPAIGIGLVANHANVSLGNRSLQSLVLALMQKHR